jgi:hypothetical protein
VKAQTKSNRKRKVETMNSTVSIQGVGTKKEAKEQLKLQLAQYVAEQPESRQTSHRLMKDLEVASLVIVGALFILAMYVSIDWMSVPPQAIPTAWFAFAGSFSLTIVLVGLHAVILRAFPPAGGLQYSMVHGYSPIRVPGKQSKFVTGREAVIKGWAVVVMGVVVAAFWAVFAYASWTMNMAILTPMIAILATVLGIGIAVSIVYSIFRSIFRSISRSS